MSITLIKIPQTQVDAEFVKWQAVHHLIEFKLQRKDQLFSHSFLNQSGTNRILIMVGAITSTVAVGQKITIFSDQFVPGSEAQADNAITTTIVSINGNAIELNGGIQFPPISGFVLFPEAIKNYFVITEVLGVDESNNYKVIGTLSSKSDILGVVNINVQKWIKSQAIYENEFLYNAINKAILGEGARYNVVYRESFNGKQSAKENINSLYFWTNSTKQLQEIFGTNMGDFTPTKDGTRADKAKFQSVFNKPTFFPGYPHSLNFIYSDNMQSFQLTRHERQLDVNGVIVGSETSDDMDHSQREFANRLMLAQGYPANVTEVEVWIEAGDEIPVSTMDLGAYIELDAFGPVPIQKTLPDEENLFTFQPL